MIIDKEKLKSLLWSVVASWKAEDCDLQRHTAALDELLGDKTVEEVALQLIGENDRLEVERDSSKLLLRDVIARDDQLKAENEALRKVLAEAGAELHELKASVGFRAHTLEVLRQIDGVMSKEAAHG
ncbi:hypothetical protein SAMN04489802_2819 [Pseudomonas chlororaphis]|uniref:hypothetical protein n=1 Tax=Pseudomonas chlororaphis TaxID=587753 RepID=UPI00087B2E98|nr:hypothetical protein [Pseudomonas chlororaphis]AZD67594.1 hypothetical protein C4K17_3708 [Pseudomonas chlororaphis subsp. aurantiaca]WDH01657.1 hypothetical protein PUP57_19260 [Pseudomonas chlororaphis]WDH09495.1 hypothetical protein PUP64_27750 [Pseudomonas chlororaphis]SDS97923.1 hypothetical protein SAMN04489802_2819 [Pseudomonas chlororaphis]